MGLRPRGGFPGRRPLCLGSYSRAESRFESQANPESRLPSSQSLIPHRISGARGLVSSHKIREPSHSRPTFFEKSSPAPKNPTVNRTGAHPLRPRCGFFVWEAKTGQPETVSSQRQVFNSRFSICRCVPLAACLPVPFARQGGWGQIAEVGLVCEKA